MRSCPLCWSKALGDEFHYLLKCEILFKKIYEISSEFCKLNYRELFKYLFNMYV